MNTHVLNLILRNFIFYYILYIYITSEQDRILNLGITLQPNQHVSRILHNAHHVVITYLLKIQQVGCKLY